MSTLYLQVGDAVEDSYPVRSGLVDVGQPGAVSLERIGVLPVTLPPRAAGMSEGTYLHGLIADAGGSRLTDLLSADPLSVVVDVRPAPLAALHWEAMAAGRRYPFIDPRCPWSRGRWTNTGLSPRTLGPLRLLVVLCDPRDPGLRAEEELDGIHRAVSRSVGRIHLEVIDSPADWTALRRELTERVPQVVHFIGHTRQTGEQSVLEFTPVTEHPTWDLTSGVIENSWPEGARLVVVSACRSDGQPASGVATLTAALKAAEVPAVLGMRGDIASSAAVDFAAEFYGQLADDQNVDAAASAGRRAIFDRAPDGEDWPYPVLEALMPAAHVLPIRFAVDYQQARDHPGIPEFLKLRRFVDRSEQRRRTWWAVDPEEVPGQQAIRGSVLITGPRKSGKTWLAQASLFVCYLRGRRLHYIDLTAESDRGELGESTKDWLGMLRAIRDGTRGCHLSPELDRQAFATFNTRLNWLVKSPPTDAMPTEARAPVEDEWQRFDSETGQGLRRIRMIFEDFVAALGKASAREHLILALDGIDGVREKCWQDYVMPHLITPLAKGIDGVSLMLVVPQDLVDRRLSGDDVATMARVEVEGFEHTQIDRVIREYGVYSQLSQAEVLRIKAFFGNAYGPILPGVFGTLEQALQLIPQGRG
jgi:hypothetical protein